MTKRKKITSEPILKNFEQVDQAIREWTSLDNKVKTIADTQQEQINKIKMIFETIAEPFIAEKIQIEKNLGDFCEFNRDKFAGKTKVLTFGKCGFRKSSKLATLKGWTWKTVLAKLLDLKRLEFVRIRKDVNKEAIKSSNLELSVLNSFGCTIKEDEIYWFEPDREAIANAERKMNLVRRAS